MRAGLRHRCDLGLRHSMCRSEFHARLLQNDLHPRISNAAFPFRHRGASRHGVRCAVLCIRIITPRWATRLRAHIPAEQANACFMTVSVEAVREVGLVHSGLRPLASLAHGKGYPRLTATTHRQHPPMWPYETGSFLRLDLKNRRLHIGQGSGCCSKGKGPSDRRPSSRVLVRIPSPHVFHAEVVLAADCVPVGLLRAAPVRP